MKKIFNKKHFVVAILVVVFVILVLVVLGIYILKNLTLVNIMIESPEHIDILEQNTLTIYTYYENNSIFSDTTVNKFKKLKKRFLNTSILASDSSIEISETAVYAEGNIIIYEIKGASNGKCSISITMDNVQKSVEILSGECEPERIKATEKIFVNSDGTDVQKISVDMYPEYSYKTVSFETEDNSIVNVDSEGNVSGLKNGETVIWSKTPNGCIAKTIVVSAKYAEEFILNDNNLSQKVGTKFTIGYEILPVDITYYSNIVWSVENENIVKQVDSGTFFALSPGTTKITASFSSNRLFEATCVITVF